MKQWAVVPMKPLGDAKSRLGSILNEEEKTKLVLTLFVHTLDQLKECHKFGGIAIITADPGLWKLAEKHQVEVIEEAAPCDLNHSLHSALPYFSEYQVDSLLILPGDLPYLNTRVLLDMIHEMEKSNMLMIAPDQHLTGTNALFLTPLDKLIFSFGEQSFYKHIQQGKQANYSIKLYFSDMLKMDIDTPEDYQQHQKVLQYLLEKYADAILLA